jgi:death-on-curing protein
MTRYLTGQEVYLLHKAIMKKHGDEEQAGIRDRGIFESALERSKAHYFGEEQYPDIFDKAAFYFWRVGYSPRR